MIGGDYTAMGDTMNLASRLEVMAEPGQIIVGPATYAASVDAIVYRTIGEVTTRGRSGTVQVYEAIRVRRYAGCSTPPSPPPGGPFP